MTPLSHHIHPSNLIHHYQSNKGGEGDARWVWAIDAMGIWHIMLGFWEHSANFTGFTSNQIISSICMLRSFSPPQPTPSLSHTISIIGPFLHYPTSQCYNHAFFTFNFIIILKKKTTCKMYTTNELKHPPWNHFLLIIIVPKKGIKSPPQFTLRSHQPSKWQPLWLATYGSSC